jgi:hypothetical protein
MPLSVLQVGTQSEQIVQRTHFCASSLNSPPVQLLLSRVFPSDLPLLLATSASTKHTTPTIRTSKALFHDFRTMAFAQTVNTRLHELTDSDLDIQASSV